MVVHRRQRPARAAALDPPRALVPPPAHAGEPLGGVADARRWTAVLVPSPRGPPRGGAPFAVDEPRTLRWSLARTPEELVGLAGTYGGVVALPAAERARLRDALTAAVREHSLLGRRELVELPMRCTCWRAIRLV